MVLAKAEGRTGEASQARQASDSSDERDDSNGSQLLNHVSPFQELPDAAAPLDLENETEADVESHDQGMSSRSNSSIPQTSAFDLLEDVQDSQENEPPKTLSSPNIEMGTTAVRAEEVCTQGNAVDENYLGELGDECGADEQGAGHMDTDNGTDDDSCREGQRPM